MLPILLITCSRAEIFEGLACNRSMAIICKRCDPIIPRKRMVAIDTKKIIRKVPNISLLSTKSVITSATVRPEIHVTNCPIHPALNRITRGKISC